MTKKDFEKLGRRLLPELPGFTNKGNLLFIYPLAHTLRAVCFDGSGFDANLFFVHVFVQPLFVPAKHIGLNLGRRIGGGSHRWDINDSSLPAELCTALKNEAVPFLARIDSPRDVVTAIESLRRSADPYAQQAVAYSLARAGESRGAILALDQLIGALVTAPYPWQREMAQRAEMLKARLQTAPDEALQQLKAWEAETAHNLGLERFRQ